MKTIKTIIAAAVILLFASCTKEYSAQAPAPADTTYHIIIKKQPIRP